MKIKYAMLALSMLICPTSVVRADVLDTIGDYVQDHPGPWNNQAVMDL